MTDNLCHFSATQVTWPAGVARLVPYRPPSSAGRTGPWPVPAKIIWRMGRILQKGSRSINIVEPHKTRGTTVMWCRRSGSDPPRNSSPGLNFALNCDSVSSLSAVQSSLSLKQSGCHCSDDLVRHRGRHDLKQIIQSVTVCRQNFWLGLRCVFGLRIELGRHIAVTKRVTATAGSNR